MEISSLQRETRYASRVMLMTIVVSSFSSSFFSFFFLRYSRILGGSSSMETMSKARDSSMLLNSTSRSLNVCY